MQKNMDTIDRNGIMAMVSERTQVKKFMSMIADGADDCAIWGPKFVTCFKIGGSHEKKDKPI